MKSLKQFRIVLLFILALCLSLAIESSPALASNNYSLVKDEQKAPESNFLNVFWVLSVNSSNDVVDGECNESHCSLREAILSAESGDTITFDESMSGATITLAGHLRIDKSLTIIGLGADLLTISGGEVPHYGQDNDVGGVFWLQGEYAPDIQPITVNISGLTIRDGRATNGGAIYNHSRSTLVLTDCVIGPNNRAIESGGGISNKYGSVTLNRCTIWGNSQKTSSGYDVAGGGGISTINSPATTTLINSTVSGNHADENGGGILSRDGGIVNLLHSTVSSNSTGIALNIHGGGGGVNNHSGTVYLHNSIVAGNADASLSPIAPDVFGNITSQGGNLIGDSTGSTNTWDTNDQVGTGAESIDPMMGALTKNDPGRTLTHALLTGSPAINGSACLADVTFDQRGIVRPQEGNTCDVGAYEVASTTGTLIVLPETIPTGESGTAYEQIFSVTGTNKAVTWSWVHGGLEDYCDLNSLIPGRLICYTNTPPPEGTYHFTITATEEGGSLTGSRSYSLVINPRLDFIPAALTSGRLGQAYNQVITVEGGTGPYTFTKTSGNLPQGITFDEGSHAFTGTPTQLGTFTWIQIQVVDSNGVTKTHIYSLEVLPEHLFTWSPNPPTSYQETTFSAISGYAYYYWSYGTELEGGCVNGLSSIQNTTVYFYGKGQYKFCLLMVAFEPYQEVTDEQWVTVTNYPPSIGSINVDPSISFPGQQVGGYFDFGDIDRSETFTCTIDWGDGTGVEAGTVDPERMVCTFPPHTYTQVGSYTLIGTITDNEAASETKEYTHVVVYLYPRESDYWLASNSEITDITLYGYAPLGTETITFNIVSDPAFGGLDDPTFVDCKQHHLYPEVECRAKVIYTPTPSNPLFVGADTFEFTVQLSGQTSTPGTVFLWLDENHSPTAMDGNATVLTNKPSHLSIHGSDIDYYEGYDVIDQLTFHIDAQPAYGTLSFDEEPHDIDWWYDEFDKFISVDWSQMLTYTPNPNISATNDTFTFHVNDTHQNSLIKTVNLELYTPITLQVNVNDDNTADGCIPAHCSLREAVNAAVNGDTIAFAFSLPNTITLTQGEILINKNIQIEGPGADQLTISAGFENPGSVVPENGYRVFHFYNLGGPVEAYISGLKISGGLATFGGGIYVDEAAEVIMKECVIGPDNTAYGGAGIGLADAILSLDKCAIIGNHTIVDLAAPMRSAGAGIYAEGSELTMANSTVGGNESAGPGGGILARYSDKITLVHSTISGNIADTADEDYPNWGGGGGIFNDESQVEVLNSIIAGNIDLTDAVVHAKRPDARGIFNSLIGNLVGDNTGSSGWKIGLGDVVGTASEPWDPKLDMIGLYAPGHTPTYPLLPGSIAIDAVFCPTEISTDQRGVPRPQGLYCDMGAYELVWNKLFIPFIRR